MSPRSHSRTRNHDQETTMQVQPYLFFDGRCDEAIDFYKKAIGTDVKMLMRFKDGPDKTMCTPDNADKVMHVNWMVIVQ
jgi:PhnB protein